MQAEDYLEIFRVAFKNAGEGVDKERVAIAVMQEMGKDKRMQLALILIIFLLSEYLSFVSAA